MARSVEAFSAPIKVERDNYQSSSIFPRRDSVRAIGRSRSKSSMDQLHSSRGSPVTSGVPNEQTFSGAVGMSQRCQNQTWRTILCKRKAARRRLVVLSAERNVEATLRAAGDQANIVTQRANVPCEYRTSPRRRHASSIGAIGSRPDALCSRAS
jgi:hypothetical protein